MSLKHERELDRIRGKMLAGAASQSEIGEFLWYVTAIEGLLEEADCQDFFGTEGWRHRIGIAD